MKGSNATGTLALACLLAVAPALGQDARDIKKSALRGVETFIALHSNSTLTVSFVGTDTFSCNVKADGIAAKRMNAVVGPRTVTVDIENP